jgi:hypothetical protein
VERNELEETTMDEIKVCWFRFGFRLD